MKETAAVPRRPALTRTRRRWTEHGRNRDLLAAVGFLSPNLLLFGVFVVVPITGALALSFFSWDLLDVPQFVGLRNYSELLRDSQALTALLRTVLFVAGGVAPTMLLAFLLAALVNVQFRGITVLRTLYYMPIVISFAASGVLWHWLYAPRHGVVNWLLSLAGIDGPAWLSDTTWALPALVVMMIWLNLPLAIILYLAGLQRVSQDVIEAAMVDGAGAWTRLWHVVWPNVRPTTILVAIVLTLSFSLGTFDAVAVMTQGGPLDSTTTLVYYMFRTAFADLRLGYASTLAIFQFLVIFVAIGGLVLLRRWREGSR